MRVTFSQSTHPTPRTGKLSDAELHFDEGDALAGLKLIGFGVWQHHIGGRTVTFPARQYSVNGERRSFALLRPVVDAAAQDALKAFILTAYVEYEERLSRYSEAPSDGEKDV